MLRLEFKAFGGENHGRYAFDRLKVVDGDWTILMDNTCGTALPPVLMSNTNHVSTVFDVTDETEKCSMYICLIIYV